VSDHATKPASIPLWTPEGSLQRPWPNLLADGKGDRSRCYTYVLARCTHQH